MNHRAALVALGVSVLASYPFAQPEAAGDPDFVELDVVVADRQGRAIPGLRLDDFAVIDDGRRVEVQTVTPRRSAGSSAPGDARLVVLLLDDVGVNPIGTSSVKTIARHVLSMARPATTWRWCG